LTVLSLSGTQVRDLSPLRGMPLEKLDFGSTAVSDLRSLQGMPLRQLEFPNTTVADLTPLRGMPLQNLELDGCESLRDLTPLADCRQLETLVIPRHCANIEFLRRLPHLKVLTYEHGDLKPAAEFWKEYDATKASSQKSAVSGRRTALRGQSFIRPRGDAWFIGTASRSLHQHGGGEAGGVAIEAAVAAVGRVTQFGPVRIAGHKT